MYLHYLGVPSGSFTMPGTYSAAGVDLRHDRWISQPTGLLRREHQHGRRGDFQQDPGGTSGPAQGAGGGVGNMQGTLRKG